jgi:outer membrane murein-binding lipoprotein Lpp
MTMTRKLTVMPAVLALVLLAGCGSGDDIIAPDDEVGEDPALEVSRDPDVQWKRAAAVERDLMRALELSSEQLCREVGVAPCVSQVHLVALGGHDPYGLGLYESLAAPLATTPIALDRVVLSGCAARADLDRDAGNAAVVFTGFDLAAVTPAGDDPRVAAMVTELYHRLLAREPLVAEIETLGELTIDDAGEPIGGRDFAVLACYAIATTTEFLFF